MNSSQSVSLSPPRNWSVWILAGLVVCLFAAQEVRFRRHLRDLEGPDAPTALPWAAETASRLDRVESTLKQFEETVPAGADAPKAPEPDNPAVNVSPSSQALPARLSQLEKKLQHIQQTLPRNSAGSFVPAVPEFDPTQPAPEISDDFRDRPPGRSWGNEQAVGPPDTHTAGDHPTAWASREPDAGPEWLQADFDRGMDVAEVRIRESFNPGAINKVTALVNGQEVVLWEGTSATGQAPRDFVVRVDQNVQAQSVVVHMDTARVRGWNEIDAIELVSRDGSRQWATSAQASSTFAEQRPTPNFQIPPGTDLFVPGRELEAR
ncbi:MAG: hypothetical protein L0Z50_13465 [Verrucomicrobiales bacterium]|nr:hypothetical protein [Verrucomicrobiales bacterium]